MVEMAATLNKAGESFARSLIGKGQVDKSSAWSFSAEDGNKLLGPNGDDWANYGKHHLGIHADQPEETKAHYGYPFAKDNNVYRGGVIAVKQRAAAQGDTAIENAAADLLDSIDKKKEEGYWKFLNQTDESVEVLIYDQIGAGYFSEGIEAKEFVENLRSKGDALKNITLRIDSPGGSIFEGLAIYNYLSQHPAMKTVFVDGLAASIASVIAMAGNKVIMPESSTMIVHDPTGFTVGNADEMRKMADTLDKLKESIVSAYASKTGLGKKEIRAMMTNETWMNGDDALDKGFCDEVIKNKKPCKIKDSYDLSMFQYQNKVDFDKGIKKVYNVDNKVGGAPIVETMGTIIDQIRTDPIVVELVKTEPKKMEGINKMDAKERMKEILAIGEKYNCMKMATDFLQGDGTTEEFQGLVLEKLFDAKKIEPSTTPAIGMGLKEISQYSLVKAIRAHVEQTWGRENSLEHECSDAVAKKMKKPAQGFYLPWDVQDYRSLRNDLTVSPGTAGGYTVGTTLLPAEFVDVLRNALLLVRLGARTLTGLIGDVAIPTRTSGATSYWVAEGVAPTEGANVFGQTTLTPHTCGGFVDISRKLLIQSSLDVESLVRDDLARSIAEAIETVAINGGGSNEPRGILQVADTTTVAMDTNGAAPTFAKICDLWALIAVANADTNGAFLTNTQVVKKLLQTLKVPTYGQEYVIGGFPDNNNMADLHKKPCGVSNLVPHTLVKNSSGAVCSALIYGNFSDLIIAMWGAVDILVDPYTYSSSGTVRVRALQDADVALRRIASFGAIADITTT
jgi:HK97 family phage major capsid protein/ATP-dependent Clp endopeptidase proteolytic subunit ClpP